jgi:hypothetical protein
MTGMINFDRAGADRLRQAYEQAKADGKDEFDFEGHKLLRSYARYLLEHLEMILPRRED